jgi:hypothetical protein
MRLASQKYIREEFYERDHYIGPGGGKGKTRFIWDEGYKLDSRHLKYVDTLITILEDHEIDLLVELDKYLK